jgi:hypothetical protein
MAVATSAKVDTARSFQNPHWDHPVGVLFALMLLHTLQAMKLRLG